MVIFLKKKTYFWPKIGSAGPVCGAQVSAFFSVSNAIVASSVHVNFVLFFRQSVSGRAGEQSMETSIVSIVSKFRESRLFFLTIDGFPFFLFPSLF